MHFLKAIEIQEQDTKIWSSLGTTNYVEDNSKMASSENLDFNNKAHNGHVNCTCQLLRE